MKVRRVISILLSVVLVIGLLITPAAAGNAIPTTHGNARLVSSVSTYTLSGGGSSDSYTEYYYDKNGNIAKKIVWSEYDTTTTTYTYDSHGNVTEEVEQAEGYTFVTTNVYTYDANGRIQKCVTNSDGYTYTSSRYKYDAYGNVIEYRTVDEYGDTEWTYLAYDKYGNCLKISSPGEYGSYTEHTVYQYDNYGNILSEYVEGEYGTHIFCEEITYTYEYPPTVVLSTQNLAIDGKIVSCEKYNINGANYFKLRDLAYLLNGTGSQFGVGWNPYSNTVSITTGDSYVPNGTELQLGKDLSSTAVSSKQTILIDGYAVGDLSVYNIGGSNFFKLRDLGEYLGFDVDYDAATRTALIYSSDQNLGVPDYSGLWTLTMVQGSDGEFYEYDPDEYGDFYFELHTDSSYLMNYCGEYSSGTWSAFDDGAGFYLYDPRDDSYVYLNDNGNDFYSVNFDDGSALYFINLGW